MDDFRDMRELTQAASDRLRRTGQVETFAILPRYDKLNIGNELRLIRESLERIEGFLTPPDSAAPIEYPIYTCGHRHAGREEAAACLRERMTVAERDGNF